MSEHEEQVALIKWWSLSHKRFKLPEYSLMAIPNGGLRHIAVAKKLKEEGLRSGAPDLELRVSRNGLHALWIEMKYGKNKPTESQIEFMAWQEAEGAKCVVCYSWEEAKKQIEEYLK
ncbi:MAG: VRR-NUC domain-containing protein [Paludibacter sp.]|nr:VRR-NUC domain-containing protein [Paludibacter sp.]